jgi:hypothetical protein
MKLKKYNDFLLESILLTSNSLSDLIKKIDDPIAKDFYELINKDIKTKYNIIDSTDDNTSLSFISDNQVSNKIKSGVNPNDLFSSSNNKTSIGRVVKSILKDNNINYTDKELATFVDKFKTEYDKELISKKEVDPIRIVKGEDIRFWYLEDNYCEDSTSRNKGTLCNSCMRYKSCQSYFDIYVENPDVVSLVIYLDKNNKLRARALLWETNQGKFLDRVYYTVSSEVKLLTDWVKKDSEVSSYEDMSSLNQLEVNIKIKDYKKYPYMDTFSYYDKDDGILCNDEPDDDLESFLELNSTDGTGVLMNVTFCEFDNESFPPDDTVYSDYSEVYMHRDSAVWSNEENSYIWADDSVYSDYMDDALIRNKSIRAYTNEEGTRLDWFPEENTLIRQDLDSGDYYIFDIMVETNDREYVLKKNAITLYSLKEDDNLLDKYEEIYNSQYYKSTLIDGKIFGFEFKIDDYVQSKSTYYINVYNKVIYKDFVEMIKSLDISEGDKDIKLAEALDANNYLMKNTKFYPIYNGIYNIGIDKLISDNIEWYKETVNEVYEHAYKTYSMWRLVDDKDKEIKDIIKEICLDPILVGNKNEVTKIIREKIGNTRAYVKFTFDVINNVLFNVQTSNGGVKSNSDKSLFMFYIENINDLKKLSDK